MRVGFPVIFMRNGVEHAGLTVTSSAKQEQVPIGGDQITRDQLFGELRCSIAYWDCEVRGWRQADNVPYLSIELEVPAEGEYYSEVGAPDPQERAAAAAAYAEALRQGSPNQIDYVPSPDPVEQPATSAELAVEEAIEESLEQGAGALESEGGPTSAELDGNPLETRPIG